MAIDFDSMAKRLASCSKIRTAGRIEFVRDQGPVRRDIRVQNYEWKPDSLRNLTKLLWAIERSHGYGLSAFRLLSKSPSSELSPDGLLGGNGYIQQIKEMRTNLSSSVEVLSSLIDTIHDEISAFHWSSIGEDPISSEIMNNTQEFKANPEQAVEDQFVKDVPEAKGMSKQTDMSDEPISYSNPSPDDYNPFVESTEDDDDDDWDSTPGFSQASIKLADSSVDPGTLPGPRVMHVGPGESDEEFGYFTDRNEVPSDDPIGEGFYHLNPIVEDHDFNDYSGYSGYENPTDGDESVFRTTVEHVGQKQLVSYSWLPGSDNQKIMNYYTPGLSSEEYEWMKANNNPDSPLGTGIKKVYQKSDPLWDVRRKP